MDQVITQFIALLAALSTAIGTPLDAKKMPDRPVIVQPVPAAAPKRAPSEGAVLPKSGATADNKNAAPSNPPGGTASSNVVKIKGVITGISGNTITVLGQPPIIISEETRIISTLQVGATIEVEGVIQNGTLFVNDGGVQPMDAKTTVTKSSDDKSGDGSGKTTSDDKGKSGGSGDKGKTGSSDDDHSESHSEDD